ncbi:MAG: hypothetical protein WCK02_15260 [Bacteroidota bacterium]
MITKTDDFLFDYCESFNCTDSELELLKTNLLDSDGFFSKLKQLKWQAYGDGLRFILFELHVRPVACLRENMKSISYYRRAQKAVSIPVIIDEKAFFILNKREKQLFLKNTISKKLELLEEKIRKNKLDTDLNKLRKDVENLLN